MISRHERRAAALEAIANALLELAAVEREPDESSPSEVLVDRRNSAKELGLSPSAFTAAAGRDFPAFRVSKRLTATKADVLAWLKTRKVSPKPHPAKPAPTKESDRDAFLKQVHTRFVARVGRSMTDQELSDADMWIDAGESLATLTGRVVKETPDAVAARIEQRIGKEPERYKDWRSFGLDPADLERQARDLRERLHREHPDWGWRERERAVDKLLGDITEPFYEARRKERADSRAARKAERIRLGQLGLKR